MIPSLTSFSDELEKNAFIAKLLRALETPIPGTPKLLMKVRDKAELAAREVARRGKIRGAVNENIYKALKKMKVDKAYQKLEPAIGHTTAPAAERALFGDREIHEMAHEPFHTLISNLPIPYAGPVHKGLRSAAQKLLGVPAAKAYVMPEAAHDVAQAIKKKMTGKEKALLAAKLTGAGAVGAGATAATMHHGDRP